jgi:hypothetical protein
LTAASSSTACSCFLSCCAFMTPTPSDSRIGTVTCRTYQPECRLHTCTTC